MINIHRIHWIISEFPKVSDENPKEYAVYKEEKEKKKENERNMFYNILIYYLNTHYDVPCIMQYFFVIKISG